MTKVLLPISYRRWVADITFSDRMKKVFTLDMRAVNKHASYCECRATRQFEGIALRIFGRFAWMIFLLYRGIYNRLHAQWAIAHIFRSLHLLLLPILTFLVQLRYPVRECECAYINVRFFIAVNKLLCVVSDKRSLPFLLCGKLQNTAPFCASCATTSSIISQ